MQPASTLRECLWALLVWAFRGMGRAGGALRDLGRRWTSRLLGAVFLLLLLGAGLGVQEGYRVFALRHGLQELAAFSHGLNDEAVRVQARKRALRLGFLAVLEDEEVLEASVEWDEEGFPFRRIRLHLQQPVELWGWTLLAYPLELDVRELIREPRPPLEQE